jgi:drug/metabolite transporter (DMT)-like permease
VNGEVMVPALFGLLSGFSFAVANLCGGFASRRSPALSVTFLAQCAGLALIAMLVTRVPGHPTSGDLAWGALAGFFHVFGVVLFYRALARGTMGVVASVMAVVGVTVPIVVGLLWKETYSPVQLAGIGMGLIAILLLSISSENQVRTSGKSDVLQGVVCGLLFGTQLVVFGLASSGSGIWPLLTARSLELLVLAGAALLTRTRLFPVRAVVGVSFLAGAGQEGGAAFFLVARHLGGLSIAAVLSSLDSAFLVILAWIIIRQRLYRRQIIGVGLAILAATLISW